MAGFVAEEVLVKQGSVVTFNPDVEWLPELKNLLRSLQPLMPKTTQHALMIRRIQDDSEDGSARSDSMQFRIFGSRANQAILCYLATYGPSGITSVCAAAGASSTVEAVAPLLESGLVTEVPNLNRRRRVISLKAAFPVYQEMRTL